MRMIITINLTTVRNHRHVICSSQATADLMFTLRLLTSLVVLFYILSFAVHAPHFQSTLKTALKSRSALTINIALLTLSQHHWWAACVFIITESMTAERPCLETSHCTTVVPTKYIRQTIFSFVVSLVAVRCRGLSCSRGCLRCSWQYFLNTLVYCAYRDAAWKRAV